MDVKDLNKSQIILLAILLAFITSIATSITTVTLLENAPTYVTLPINQVVTETVGKVEKIVPGDKTPNFETLSADQKNLLEELKAIKPLTVTLYLKGSVDKKIPDKILGTGLFLGNEKIVIATVIPSPKEGEIYVVKSVLGEQNVSKVTVEKDFTLIEVAKVDVLESEDNLPNKEDVLPVTDNNAQ